MKKIITSLVFITVICATITVSADTTKFSGGWYEQEGVTQNSGVNAYSTPYHYGSVQERNANPPSSVERRTLGTTQWPGVYHYTRARMENRFTGSVYTDSNRVYGTGTTNAISPWYKDSFEFKLSIGKTYYGN